jgi:RES domain-containing protein
MILHRICSSNYKDDISGNGARLFGARWNSKGVPMLYTTEHISLAALEMLVHINYTEVPGSFHVLSIFIPDNVTIAALQHSKLKPTWRIDPEYSTYIGDEFIKSKESLCLKVPSAVIEQENNFLINPLHVDFKKVRITATRQFEFDNRLFSI